MREFEDLNSFLNTGSGQEPRQYYLIRDFPSGTEVSIAPVSTDEGIYGSETYVGLASLKKNQSISKIIGVFCMPKDDPKVIDEVRACAKAIELRDAATMIFTNQATVEHLLPSSAVESLVSEEKDGFKLIQ